MYRIELRPATNEELALAKRLAGFDWGSLACVTVVIGGGTLSIFFCGGVVASLWFANALTIAVAGGIISGLLATGLFLLNLLPGMQHCRERARNDVKSGLVEIVTIEDAKVAQIDLINNCDTSFVFEIDDGTLLLLCGQWLNDPEIYGEVSARDPLVDDACALGEILECELYQFPGSSFRLTRFPSCGEVLSIEVDKTIGLVNRENREWIAPFQTQRILKASEFLDGELPDIREILGQSHTKDTRL